MKILAGTEVSRLAPVARSPNEYLFDKQVLNRLGIELPLSIREHAGFVNSQSGFSQVNHEWELGTLLALFILLLMVLVMVVVLLLLQHSRLRKNERALIEKHNDLIQTRENLEIAQQLAHIGSWSLDIVNNRLVWSDEIYRIFEVDKESFDVSYEAFLNVVHPDDRDRVNKAYIDSLKTRSRYKTEHRLKMPDGRIKYVQERGVTQYNELDEPVCSHGTVQDVTKKKLDERRLKQWASVFENTIEAVVITDTDQTIVDVNRAYCEITGYSRQEVLGKKPNFRSSGRHDRTFYEAMWDSIDNTGSWSGEIWNRTKTGELSPEWHSVSTIRDENGNLSNYIEVFTDISVLKRSEEKLEQLAHHDPLTGLANRSLLFDRVKSAIRRMDRENAKLAVLFLDLDYFKDVNDTWGHPIGDILLQEVAACLHNAIRDSDTIGRLGGDEFLVLIEDYERIEDITNVAEKLCQVMEQPFFVKDYELNISVSIGIAIFPDHGKDNATLIRNADSALYRAKESGRNTYCFYE